MKKVLAKIIACILMVLIVIVEWLLKLLVKCCTIASGLLMNVLVVCMIVSIFTKQWFSLGILTGVMVLTFGLVYGHATLLFTVGEAREYARNIFNVTNYIR